MAEENKSPEAGQNNTGAGTEGDKSIVGDAGAKGNEGAGDPGAGEGDKGKPATGAPEAYAEFVLPEGFTLDPEAKTGFMSIAKELNLPQDAAQKLVEFQANVVKKQADAAQAEYTKTTTDWKNETLKRFGANKDAKLAAIGKVMDKCGTPALREFLNVTGLGNQPELAELFATMGQLISEDSMGDGKSGSGKKEKTNAELFYPNMAKEGQNK